MSDLFGWFQSYLNLSKITAVTVPGMVIAFALVLVLGPIPCRDDVKNCPYCTDSLKPAGAAAAAAAAETVTAKFQMGGVNNKTAVSTDDSHTLVIDWDNDSYNMTQPDPKKGGTVAPSGPTATFISTSGPDVSDISNYSWMVNGTAICGTSEKPAPPAKQTPKTVNPSQQTDGATPTPAGQGPAGATSGKPAPSLQENGPGDDPSGLAGAKADKSAVSPTSACGQFLSHRFTQPGNYTITLKVTNKDGKSASTAGLVAVLPPKSKPSPKPPPAPPSAAFISCFQNDLVKGHCPGTPSPYPDKFDIKYNDSRPRYFDGTANADPDKNVYAWKEDGYPICYAANCLIPFNTPDGRANQTGSRVISLDVISKADKTLKSSGSQIIERDPVPPLVVHPTSLSFLTVTAGRVIDSKQPLTLIVSPATQIRGFAISNAGPDAGLFHISLPDGMRQGNHALPPGQYSITVTYSPHPGIVRYLAPQLWLDHFRARRSSNATSTLSIVTVDSSTGVDQQISISVPLSAAPDPGVALANDAASKQKKLANNTVITSTATFMKSSPDAKGEVNRNAVVNDLNAILGTNDPAVANFTSSCKGIPVYVVGGSRPAPIKAGSSSDASSQSKQGVPQYSGESATSVEDILTISDECQLALTRLDQRIQQITNEKQAALNEANTELGSLTTSLTNAQTAGSRLVEADLSKKVAAKSAEVATAQGAVKSLTQADAYVNALNSLTNTSEKSVEAQVNGGATSDNSNTVTDVFTTIQQHFIMFLLFSLIIGSMFDPIQRGLLSYVGPRRSVFIALNHVYGLNRGDGEFRYGDRRLPPWTDRLTYLPDLRNPRTTAQAASWKRKADEQGLRYSPADFVFRRNMNIYDQNYAIGAQYISQSEFNHIYNEFFRESQITTGLILPLLILSICIGIRYICCASYAVSGGTAWWAVGSVIGAVYMGVVAGLLVLAFAARMGSKMFGEVVSQALHIGFLSLRSDNDPEGRTLRSERQALGNRRKKLEDEREWLADHAEWLTVERKWLDEEYCRYEKKDDAGDSHHPDCDKFLADLEKACLSAVTASTASKDISHLLKEGRKLYDECRKHGETKDKQPLGTDEFKKDWKDSYNQRKQHYEEVKEAYKTRNDDYKKQSAQFRTDRQDLNARMRDYKAKITGSGNLGDRIHWALQEPFIKGLALMMIPAIVVIYANLEIVKLETLPLIALPSLFLAPLWVVGLDRLHKYYSELQARIAGNILRQQQTTIQRMVDVVTSSDSRKDLIANLNTAVTEQGTLLNFLQSSVTKKTGPGPDAQSLGLEPLSKLDDDDSADPSSLDTDSGD